MFKNYIFNLYGTVLDINYDLSKKEVWDKLAIYLAYMGIGYKPDELKEKFSKQLNKLLEINAKISNYELNYEDVFSRIFSVDKIRPKKRIAKEAAQILQVMSTTKPKTYPKAIETIDKIREDGGKIFFISDVQKPYTKNDIRYFGLTDKIEAYYIISDEISKKSEKKLLGKIIKENDLKAKKTLLVSDDYSMDIMGAIENGIATCYVNKGKKSKKRKADYEIMACDISEVLKF